MPKQKYARFALSLLFWNSGPTSGLTQVGTHLLQETTPEPYQVDRAIRELKAVKASDNDMVKIEKLAQRLRKLFPLKMRTTVVMTHIVAASEFERIVIAHFNLPKYELAYSGDFNRDSYYKVIAEKGKIVRDYDKKSIMDFREGHLGAAYLYLIFNTLVDDGVIAPGVYFVDFS